MIGKDPPQARRGDHLPWLNLKMLITHSRFQLEQKKKTPLSTAFEQVAVIDKELVPQRTQYHPHIALKAVLLYQADEVRQTEEVQIQLLVTRTYHHKLLP